MRDLIGKREAKSGAVLRTGAAFVHHIKRFRDLLDFFLRDAPAMVAHAKDLITAVDLPVQLDEAARF